MPACMLHSPAKLIQLSLQFFITMDNRIPRDVGFADVSFSHALFRSPLPLDALNAMASLLNISFGQLHLIIFVLFAI